jgi:hypothetical protein
LCLGAGPKRNKKKSLLVVMEVIHVLIYVIEEWFMRIVLLCGA